MQDGAKCCAIDLIVKLLGDNKILCNIHVHICKYLGWIIDNILYQLKEEDRFLIATFYTRCSALQCNWLWLISYLPFCLFFCFFLLHDAVSLIGPDTFSFLEIIKEIKLGWSKRLHYPQPHVRLWSVTNTYCTVQIDGNETVSSQLSPHTELEGLLPWLFCPCCHQQVLFMCA